MNCHRPFFILAATAIAFWPFNILADQAEKKYKIRFETTQHTRFCQAKVSLEYTQRNTIASVEGTIENEDCGASGGTYTVAIRYRDENGELQTFESEESWQRDADEDYAFEKDYFIGENVDLVRVRARKIRCVCAETPAEDEDPAQTGVDDE